MLVPVIRVGEELTGLDAAKEILAKHPEAKIVFLNQFDQDSQIKKTYQMGGHAFVTQGL
jgi:DNA-binding NarL/FixJ family response regulator